MKPISRRIYAIAAMICAAVIFAGINIAADAIFTTERLDLTENGLYTLAPGTRHIVQNLGEPITLKFYYSKKVAADYAQIQAYANRVRDLLQEYAALSHGKIVVQEIDPEPYTPEEDEASASGLSAAPTDTGDSVYFGLVGSNTIDGREAIPFFSQDREPYLEYDLTSLIYRLSTPKKPVVGVISSLPLDTGAGGMMAALQGRARPFVIYEQLQQTYDTKMLDPDFKSIPSNVDVLMIVQPPTLNAQQIYSIDQFVLHGGRALVFVDPLSELSNAGLDQQQSGPAISDLPELFHAWGVSYNPGKVIGDKALAQAVQVSADPAQGVARYPVWLHLDAKEFDPNDQVTASLQLLNLASAGALFPLKGATTKFAPLVTSSDQASLLDSEEVRAGARPQDLLAAITPTGRHYVIAARISGPAKTAFPGGPPNGETESAPEIKQSTGPINVIVMADSDIFDDRFWVRVENLYGHHVAAPFADNAAFVLNAVENLTGNNDLISLRTRATNDRPFTVVKKLQADAQARFQQKADALQAKLTDTQNRLRELEQGASVTGEPSTAAALTPEQKAEIEKFKRDLIQTRADLRDVQHNLRREVDALGSLLAFVNIALVPLLVAAFAIVLAIIRRRRRARAITV